MTKKVHGKAPALVKAGRATVNVNNPGVPGNADSLQVTTLVSLLPFARCISAAVAASTAVKTIMNNTKSLDNAQVVAAVEAARDHLESWLKYAKAWPFGT